MVDKIDHFEKKSIKNILSKLITEFDNTYKSNFIILNKYKNKNLNIKNNQLNSWDVEFYLNLWKNNYIDLNNINQYFNVK